MTKRTRLFLAILVIIVLILVGVFAWLFKTGKIKIGAVGDTAILTGTTVDVDTNKALANKKIVLRKYDTFKNTAAATYSNADLCSRPTSKNIKDQYEIASGKDGKFSIKDLPATKYYINFCSPNDTTYQELKDQGSTIDLAAGTTEIKVQYPIAQIQTTADKNGNYSFAKVPAGKYTATSTGNVTTKTGDIEIKDGQKTTFDFVTVPVANLTINGHVTVRIPYGSWGEFSSDDNVSGIAVSICSGTIATTCDSSTTTKTDANGNFKITKKIPLTQKTIAFGLSKDGYQSRVSGTFDLTGADDIAYVVITTQSDGTVDKEVDSGVYITQGLSVSPTTPPPATKIPNSLEGKSVAGAKITLISKTPRKPSYTIIKVPSAVKNQTGDLNLSFAPDPALTAAIKDHNFTVSIGDQIASPQQNNSFEFKQLPANELLPAVGYIDGHPFPLFDTLPDSTMVIDPGNNDLNDQAINTTAIVKILNSSGGPVSLNSANPNSKLSMINMQINCKNDDHICGQVSYDIALQKEIDGIMMDLMPPYYQKPDKGKIPAFKNPIAIPGVAGKYKLIITSAETEDFTLDFTISKEDLTNPTVSKDITLVAKKGGTTNNNSQLAPVKIILDGQIFINGAPVVLAKGKAQEIFGEVLNFSLDGSEAKNVAFPENTKGALPIDNNLSIGNHSLLMKNKVGNVRFDFKVDKPTKDIDGELKTQIKDFPHFEIAKINTATHCNNNDYVKGVNFCFVSFKTDDQIKADAHTQKQARIFANALKPMMDPYRAEGQLQGAYFVLNDVSDYINAEASISHISIKIYQAFYDDLEKQYPEQEAEFFETNTVVHEFGHLLERVPMGIDDLHENWKLFYKAFVKNGKDLTGLPIIQQRLLYKRTRTIALKQEGVLAKELTGKEINLGHPWDNEREAFASNFTIFNTDKYKQLFFTKTKATKETKTLQEYFYAFDIKWWKYGIGETAKFDLLKSIEDPFPCGNIFKNDKVWTQKEIEEGSFLQCSAKVAGNISDVNKVINSTGAIPGATIKISEGDGGNLTQNSDNSGQYNSQIDAGQTNISVVLPSLPAGIVCIPETTNSATVKVVANQTTKQDFKFKCSKTAPVALTNNYTCHISGNVNTTDNPQKTMSDMTVAAKTSSGPVKSISGSTSNGTYYSLDLPLDRTASIIITPAPPSGYKVINSGTANCSSQNNNPIATAALIGKTSSASGSGGGATNTPTPTPKPAPSPKVEPCRDPTIPKPSWCP